MNPLDELKYIVTSQKTVTTNRLGSLVDAASELYIKKDNKIAKQRNKLNQKDEEIQKLKKLNADLAYQHGLHMFLEDEKKRLRKGVKR